MNKVRVRSWEDIRAALHKVAGDDACQELDRMLASGRKLSAIELLRENGIAVEREN